VSVERGKSVKPLGVAVGIDIRRQQNRFILVVILFDGENIAVSVISVLVTDIPFRRNGQLILHIVNVAATGAVTVDRRDVAEAVVRIGIRI